MIETLTADPPALVLIYDGVEVRIDAVHLRALLEQSVQARHSLTWARTFSVFEPDQRARAIDFLLDELIALGHAAALNAVTSDEPLAELRAG